MGQCQGREDHDEYPTFEEGRPKKKKISITSEGGTRYSGFVTAVEDGNRYYDNSKEEDQNKNSTIMRFSQIQKEQRLSDRLSQIGKKQRLSDQNSTGNERNRDSKYLGSEIRDSGNLDSGISGGFELEGRLSDTGLLSELKDAAATTGVAAGATTAEDKKISSAKAHNSSASTVTSIEASIAAHGSDALREHASSIIAPRNPSGAARKSPSSVQKKTSNTATTTEGERVSTTDAAGTTAFPAAQRVSYLEGKTSSTGIRTFGSSGTTGAERISARARSDTPSGTATATGAAGNTAAAERSSTTAPAERTSTSTAATTTTAASTTASSPSKAKSQPSLKSGGKVSNTTVSTESAERTSTTAAPAEKTSTTAAAATMSKTEDLQGEARTSVPRISAAMSMANEHSGAARMSGVSLTGVVAGGDSTVATGKARSGVFSDAGGFNAGQGIISGMKMNPLVGQTKLSHATSIGKLSDKHRKHHINQATEALRNVGLNSKAKMQEVHSDFRKSAAQQTGVAFGSLSGFSTVLPKKNSSGIEGAYKNSANNSQAGSQ